MGLPKPDIHLRLSERAMEELRFLAAASDADLAKVASQLLESALLGAGHSIKVAAQRAIRAGILGDREGR